jgi:hypothetical protein
MSDNKYSNCSKNKFKNKFKKQSSCFYNLPAKLKCNSTQDCVNQITKYCSPQDMNQATIECDRGYCNINSYGDLINK